MTDLDLFLDKAWITTRDAGRSAVTNLGVKPHGATFRVGNERHYVPRHRIIHIEERP